MQVAPLGFLSLILILITAVTVIAVIRRQSVASKRKKNNPPRDEALAEKEVESFSTKDADYDAEAVATPEKEEEGGEVAVKKKPNITLIVSIVLLGAVLIGVISSIGWCSSAPSADIAISHDAQLVFAPTEGGVSVVGYSNEYPEYIDTISIPRYYEGVPVVSIGDYAFAKLPSLNSVYISDTIRSIGEGAFEKNHHLHELYLGEGVTHIGERAFADCSVLSRFTLPASVEYIGREAFAECGNLHNVRAESIERWCAIEFADEYANPMSNGGVMLELGDELLNGRIHVPEGVVSIGDYAFCGFDDLNRIYIPSSVEYIGFMAMPTSGGTTIYCSHTERPFGWNDEWNFSNCAVVWGYDSDDDPFDPSFPDDSDGEQDESVVIVDELRLSWNDEGTGYTVIGIEDPYLSEITIPSEYNGYPVTAIDDGIFQYSPNLRYLCIPGSVTTIGIRAFASCSFLEELVLNEGVVTIGAEAFYGCSALTELTIPDSVQTIDSSAFECCGGLDSVTLGDGVERIGSYAFASCGMLTEVEIPESVSAIESYAFYDCTALERVTIPEGVDTVDAYVFTGSYKAVVYCEDDYQPDTWSYSWCESVATYWGHSTDGVFDYSYEVAERGYSVVNVLDKSATYLRLPEEHDGYSIVGFDHRAFWGCYDLNNLNVPSGVVWIRSGAFSSCNFLEKVYYGGTEEAWQNVSVSDMGNENLFAARFYWYSETQPAINGNYWYYDEYGQPTVWPHKNSEGLAYEPSADGESYILSGIGACTDTILLIPNLHDGLPVSAIAPVAFYGNEQITDVYIPDTVLEIGEGAFAACPNLSTVYIGEGVVAIGEVAFSNSPSLSKITVSSHNLTFESVDGNLYYLNPDGTREFIQYAIARDDAEFSVPEGITRIGAYAFMGATSLTRVQLPNTLRIIDECAFRDTGLELVDLNTTVVIHIGSWAFEDCTSLEMVYLNNILEGIAEGAFEGCIALDYIVIPESVTYLGPRVFTQCEGITIYCERTEPLSGWDYNWNDEGNPVVYDCYAGSAGLDYLISDDGKYFNVVGMGDCRDVNIIIPPLRSRNYPVPVRGIGFKAFYMKNIETVTLTDGIMYIGESAFDGCNQLVSVTLGESVEQIGLGAFNNCGRLAEVVNNSPLQITVWSGLNSSINVMPLTVVSGESTIDDESYLDYRFITVDSQSYLLGYYGEGMDIVLPESYNGGGYRISNYAFYGLNIESAVIPSGVTAIGTSAFNGASLSAVYIPATVTTVDRDAFYYCTNATVYCEAADLPYGWNSLWLYGGGRTVLDCGSIVGSQGLEYTLVDGSYYTVTGLGTCTDTEVVIPLIYDGLFVRAIGDDAFYNCDSLTSVTIPDSVTSIGNNAFSGCSSLTGVTISDSVTSIGYNAFYGCNSALYTEYEYGRYVGDDNNPYALLYELTNKNFTTYKIHEQTKIIGYGVFERCDSLTSVTIPDSVTSIGSSAFYNCGSLAGVTIGNGVTSIGDSAFWNCTSLTNISVDANNEYYSSLDGNLYDKNRTTLIQYAIDKTDTHFVIPSTVTSIGEMAFRCCDNLTGVTIPDSVTSIGNYAFAYCRSLTSVTIPDSVTSIGEGAFEICSSLTGVTIPDSVTSIDYYAFAWCSSLTSVTIPDSVTSIGNYAFYDCDSLDTVYYTGTAAEWGDISIDSYNSSLANAIRYYYSESEPTTVGNYWHYVDGVPTKW